MYKSRKTSKKLFISDSFYPQNNQFLGFLTNLFSQCIQQMVEYEREKFVGIGS